MIWNPQVCESLHPRPGRAGHAVLSRSSENISSCNDIEKIPDSQCSSLGEDEQEHFETPSFCDMNNYEVFKSKSNDNNDVGTIDSASEGFASFFDMFDAQSGKDAILAPNDENDHLNFAEKPEVIENENLLDFNKQLINTSTNEQTCDIPSESNDTPIATSYQNSNAPGMMSFIHAKCILVLLL